MPKSKRDQQPCYGEAYRPQRLRAVEPDRDHRALDRQREHVAGGQRARALRVELAGDLPSPATPADLCREHQQAKSITPSSNTG